MLEARTHLQVPWAGQAAGTLPRQSSCLSSGWWPQHRQLPPTWQQRLGHWVPRLLEDSTWGAPEPSILPVYMCRVWSAATELSYF